MTSIKDIAKLANVSPSTVSRVINNKEYVKSEIRERILALVAETGYVPNQAARSMVLQRTFTVGIVIPDTFNMFQRQLFSTIERQLEGYGYRTLFFFVKWEPESELRCLRRLKAEMLDGIIMIHEVGHPEFYEYLAMAGVPVVLCTFERSGYAFPAVHVDEEGAAKAATEHLASLGHSKIGLISGTHFSFGAQRVSGYRAALKKVGISYEEKRVILVPSYTPEEGRQGMHRLLCSDSKITAVFAVTDELAVGAMRALYEEGVRVPNDISVMGLDDIDISAYLSPALSTVRQPIREMGKKTADIMYSLIAEGGKATVESSIFSYDLIVRETTKAPKKSTPR
jgi:LacI family transcriptional regulator